MKDKSAKYDHKFSHKYNNLNNNTMNLHSFYIALFKSGFRMTRL